MKMHLESTKTNYYYCAELVKAEIAKLFQINFASIKNQFVFAKLYNCCKCCECIVNFVTIFNQAKH